MTNRRYRQINAAILGGLILLGILFYNDKSNEIEVLEVEIIRTEEVKHSVTRGYERQIRKMADEKIILLEQIDELLNRINELEEELEDIKSRMHTARITMYSPLDDRNGINSEGDPNITASGMRSGPNVVAVDPRRIPYGTRLKIEGFERTFVAGDTGGAMRNYNGIAIDVYTSSFDTAMAFGVQERKIKILD